MKKTAPRIASTARVEFVSPNCVDHGYGPDGAKEVAQGQMTMELAIELSSDLSKFIEQVENHPFNGIVGDVNNYFQVDAQLMMQRMLETARKDVQQLLQ